MFKKSKPQPPLSLRLRRYKEAKEREFERYGRESINPSARGHARALVDVLEMLKFAFDADESKIREHLERVAEVLETNMEQTAALVKLKVDDGELRRYHKGQAIEFKRLAAEVQALRKPLPEDLL